MDLPIRRQRLPLAAASRLLLSPRLLPLLRPWPAAVMLVSAVGLQPAAVGDSWPEKRLIDFQSYLRLCPDLQNVILSRLGFPQLCSGGCLGKLLCRRQARFSCRCQTGGIFG